MNDYFGPPTLSNDGQMSIFDAVPAKELSTTMPSTELMKFEFPATGAKIRTVMINGEPWFVAADVCRALEIVNPSDAIRSLDDDEYQQVDATLVTTEGIPTCYNVINEAGLYSLILRSRKPEAKTFKRWITHDVLPSIRKTGSYGTVAALPKSYADALRELATAVEEREALEARRAIEAPKAEAWDHFLSADGDFSVADAAKNLSRHYMIKVGRDRLFEILEKWGWIYRQKSDNRYRVYQAQVETGRLWEKPGGTYWDQEKSRDVVAAPQVRVTPKGLEDIRRKLLGTPRH